MAKILCPSPQKPNTMLWAPLAGNSVVAHCSLLVWVGRSEKGGGVLWPNT